MNEVFRLREKIRDFNAAPAAEEPEQVSPSGEIDEAREARRQELAAGFCEAIDKLTEILDQECEAVRKHRISAIPEFARAKEQMLASMERILDEAVEDGLSLRANYKGIDAEERLRRFDDATRRNMAALEALNGAVKRVVDLTVKAMEAENSEGLYARGGKTVRPTEVSPAGINLDL
ncbi:hypothetical protein [Rhodospirillaceae bacterium SYSU D60014]|uniref:hypothetical protein n=1 Tax=Virgifigura deserti TaxID=2268457 RepID=UPI000E66BA9D